MPLSLAYYIKKFADIGGDGENDSFEQAFSNLAHAYIQQSAPNLEPYELGFQMLERSDDGERAAGITGFQVDDQLMYTPVFWLRGRIKGNELLYLKNLDMFVPLKENWLNYIMQRKPPRIGESVTRNPQALGIRQPDLLRMTRSPYKYASTSTTQEELDLPAFIRAGGRDAFFEFVKFANAAPELAELAHHLHGENLLNALDEAAHEPVLTVKHASDFETTIGDDEVDGDMDNKSIGRVRITSYSMILTDDVPDDMTDDEKRELLSRGITIRDGRPNDDKSNAYYEEPAINLFNPNNNGLYDVITRNYGVQRCLVLVNPWAPTGRCRHGLVIFVDLDDAPCLATSLRNVWCTQHYTSDALTKFIAEQDTPTDIEIDPFYSDYFIIVSPDAKACSVPLQAGKAFDDNSWELSDYHVDHTSNYYDVEAERRPYTKQLPDPYISHAKLTVDSRVGTHFRTMDGTLFVPSNVRVLFISVSSGSTKPVLGRVSALKEQMYQSMCKLAVFHDGSEVTLRSDLGIHRNITPVDALDRLINKYGLKVDAAKEILKTAATRKHMRVFIKLASPYLSDEGPFGPSSIPLQDSPGTWQMRSGDTTIQQEPQDQLTPIQIPREPFPYRKEVNYVDPGNAINIAQYAAQTGQKDVFDASVMTTMLRNMRDDQLIDRFIPALARAMDATGRLLFEFYWHQEDFADRFGDKDMPEMEDSFRNLFEGLGDVVLKLKQKTIEAYPQNQQLGVSLNDLAGAS